MYGCAGGGIGDGELMRMLKDEEESPSVGAIIRMCRHIGIKKDNHRTIDNEGAWEYFYELLYRIAPTMSREEIYAALASYLSKSEVDEHLAHIEQIKRRTA